MGALKLQPTPKERAIADRVRRGRPRKLAAGWKATAIRFADEHGLDVDRVLDTLDEQTALRVYGGDDFDVAQGRAWNDTTEILCPTT